MAVRPIDAAHVLNDINWHHKPTPVSEFESGFNQGLNQAMWIITHAPTLTPPNEWISVEDRLPEDEARQYIEDELDSVKCERDAAIKDLFEIIGDIEEIRCGYGVDNADTDEAFAELCNGYCANAGNLCYEEGEHYRCKHFKWRGPHKEED